ncbi:conserved hypothetical protein [Vibrio chagasii]|nr:conserved hypothetical protein [Vibrio chagasii]
MTTLTTANIVEKNLVSLVANDIQAESFDVKDVNGSVYNKDHTAEKQATLVVEGCEVSKLLISETNRHNRNRRGKVSSNSEVTWLLEWEAVEKQEDAVKFTFTAHSVVNVSRLKSEEKREQRAIENNQTVDAIEIISEFKAALSKEVVDHRVSRLINETTEKAERYFENQAVVHAENLLEKEKSDEWQHILEQEKALKDMLKSIGNRKAKMRKSILEEKVFSEEELKGYSVEQQAVIKEKLFDKDGITQMKMFNF